MEFDVLGQESEVSVLVVDDESITRTLLADFLASTGLRVVGAVPQAKAALTMFRDSAPDVLLLDIDLGDGPFGLELAQEARKIDPDVGIAFLSSVTDIRAISPNQPALPEASVYLNKTEVKSTEQIKAAIQKAYELARSETPQDSQSTTLESEPLTDLQFELMRLVALGKSNSAIAALKFTTVKSTENAISRLAKKLDIPHNADTNQRVLIAREFFKLNKGDIEKDDLS